MPVAFAVFDERRLLPCYAQGYATYTHTAAADDAQSFASTMVNGIRDCYWECASRSECGVFEFNDDDDICRLFTTFSSTKSATEDYTLGFPCCPPEGYVTYSESNIRNPGTILDYFVVGEEDAADKCYASCSMDSQCDYFFVQQDNCALCSGEFNYNSLTSDDVAIVGVPCSI